MFPYLYSVTIRPNLRYPKKQKADMQRNRYTEKEENSPAIPRNTDISLARNGLNLKSRRSFIMLTNARKARNQP